MDWKYNANAVLLCLVLLLLEVIFTSQQQIDGDGNLNKEEDQRQRQKDYFTLSREEASSKSLEMIEDYLTPLLSQYFPFLSTEFYEEIDEETSARGKKKKRTKKFILPMIFGALLVKSLILPVILKALAVLSSKAVLLSMISLIVASVLGVKRAARNSDSSGPQTEVQVIHVPYKHYGHKRFTDLELNDDFGNNEPYKGYATTEHHYR